MKRVCDEILWMQLKMTQLLPINQQHENAYSISLLSQLLTTKPRLLALVVRFLASLFF